jgi:hypothetical protein
MCLPPAYTCAAISRQDLQGCSRSSILRRIRHTCEHCGCIFNQKGHLLTPALVHTLAPFGGGRLNVSTSHSSNLRMKDRRTHLQLHCVKMPLACEHCNDHAEKHETDTPVALVCALQLQNECQETSADPQHHGGYVGAGGALRGHSARQGRSRRLRLSNGEESFACAHGDVSTCDKDTRTDGEPMS